MDWLSPYIVPVIVGAILLRRALRTQKPKRVRFTQLWLFPALLFIVTISSVSHGSAPGIFVSIAWVIAMVVGGLVGWYRVHTLEFSVDSKSGKVSARATQVGALLLVGLIALRYGAEALIKNIGHGGEGLVWATDALLLFSTAMFVARSVHTWIRARALVIAYRSTPPLPDNSTAA